MDTETIIRTKGDLNFNSLNVNLFIIMSMGKV